MPVMMWCRQMLVMVWCLHPRKMGGERAVQRVARALMTLHPNASITRIFIRSEHGGREHCGGKASPLMLSKVKVHLDQKSLMKLRKEGPAGECDGVGRQSHPSPRHEPPGANTSPLLHASPDHQLPRAKTAPDMFGHWDIVA